MHDRNEAQAQGEIAHQQHQEGRQRLIRGDEQRCPDDKHQYIAAIGHLEPGVEDQRFDRQQVKNSAKSGRSLPTSAISGLPPAQRSQARRLRRENSVPPHRRPLSR